MQLIATVEARGKTGAWFEMLKDADYKMVVAECERLKKEGYKVRVRNKRMVAKAGE